jgi:hypothetical protein
MAGSLGAAAINSDATTCSASAQNHGEAWPMTVHVYFVAETLQRMEQQNALIRPHAASIAAALQANQYRVALQTSESLHRTLKAFVEMSARVRDHVAANDGMGVLSDEVGELALRARAFVVTSHLESLSDVLQNSYHERTREWFGGDLADIAKLRTFMLDKLQAIHSTWLPYRAGQSHPGMLESEQAATHRLMIRAAQRRLCELRNEPDIERFLMNGIAATDLPKVQLACKHIDMVLGLEIDVEAGRLMRKRVRIGTPPGVPEQQ